jgi:hypothetical protein
MAIPTVTVRAQTNRTTVKMGLVPSQRSRK